MRTESTTEKDPSASVSGEAVPRSPWRVTAVETLPGLQLRVAFADGLTGTVDMSRLVRSPKAGVFAALADPSLFAQVKLDLGAVTWPGDLDLAPDAMHAAIQERGVWLL
ncbi:MAG: DUF2442 domain-containing protein [Terracidiphilus sp.]|nr:DUF2442 domain-containing protein [Terracidiphilus sp.]MDR3797521.1 DUF2442 domain-containing protein [Terracidiphilus sp.]